jgi:hypothetical protein
MPVPKLVSRFPNLLVDFKALSAPFGVAKVLHDGVYELHQFGFFVHVPSEF